MAHTMSNNPPKRIYLQTETGEMETGDEMSWCRDQINETDIEYLLAPDTEPEPDGWRERQYWVEVLTDSNRNHDPSVGVHGLGLPTDLIGDVAQLIAFELTEHCGTPPVQQREPEGATLYRRMCERCGAYKGTVTPDECDGGEFVGPHHFGDYEVYLDSPPVQAPREPTRESLIREFEGAVIEIARDPGAKPTLRYGSALKALRATPVSSSSIERTARNLVAEVEKEITGIDVEHPLAVASEALSAALDRVASPLGGGKTWAWVCRIHGHFSAPSHDCPKCIEEDTCGLCRPGDDYQCSRHNPQFNAPPSSEPSE